MNAGRAALAALTLWAATARAQEPTQANLVFSIGLGLTTGSQLWHLPQQPAPVVGGGADTLSLGRWLRPELTGTLGITYFRSRSLGYTFEIGYFGLGSEQRCTGPAAYLPDVEEINRQACTSAQGQNVATSAVGMQVGITYRFNATSHFSPYLRVGAGPALMGTASFVTTVGVVKSVAFCNTTDQICNWVLLEEKDPMQLGWIATLAGGVAFYLGPAYRIRVEARDLVALLPYPTGPSDPLGGPERYAPVGTKVMHVPTVTFGLDVVLERRHSRRY